MKQNVLVVGNGGREHAIAWKLRQSPRLGSLYCGPGNGGTAQISENVDIDPLDPPHVVNWARDHQVDLVVVGPEAPLAAGLADAVRQAGLLAFGPSAAAAEIESSKIWCKEFCRRQGIPTANATATSDLGHALRALEKLDFPVVIKADGLAGGKGVAIVGDRETAESVIRGYLLEGQLGEAGRSILIEEYLDGVEVSLLAFTDGERIAVMPSARDHKRAFDGDAGPNTGGMGAFAPVPDVDAADLTRQFLEPAVRGLAAEGRPFQGVLYAGLMLTQVGPKLLEYNCRFGDPETQVILPLLQSDLLDVVESTARGSLDPASVRWSADRACGVVMAAEGYPGPIRSGDAIHGLNSDSGDSLVFHAGTRATPEGVVTSGGRVLTVVGRGSTFGEARAQAYRGVDSISFAGAQVRHDIGRVREARPAHPSTLEHGL